MAQSGGGGKRRKNEAKPPPPPGIDDQTESPEEQIIHIVETSGATMQNVDSVHNIDLPASGRYVWV